MTLPVSDQVADLIGRAQALGPTRTSLDLLEQAARLADAHGNVDAGFNVRQLLMWYARQMLRGDLLVTAFTWALAQHDREPARFSHFDVLWAYRQTIGLLSNLPEFARARVDELVEDMIKRYRAAGASLRPIYLELRHIAIDYGDRDMARRYDVEFHRHPPDEFSDSPDWETYCGIDHLLFIGDEAGALRLAEPSLRRSRGDIMSDQHCSLVLLPLARRDGPAEALRVQRRMARRLNSRPTYYWPFGEHLKLLALTGELDAAVKLFDQFQAKALHDTDPLTQLHFWLDAVPLYDQLARSGRETIMARLPDSLPVKRVDGGYPVSGLRGWILQRAQGLADQFDARNGNNHYNEEFRQRLELRPFSGED